MGEPVRPTSPLLRLLLAVAGLLAVSLGALLYGPATETDTWFAWTIKSPLTATFLGASYFGAAVVEVMGAREPRWSNTRIAVPAVWLFTAVTLAVTVVHFDRFHTDAPDGVTAAITWIWVVVYAAMPFALGTLGLCEFRQHGALPRVSGRCRQ